MGLQRHPTVYVVKLLIHRSKTDKRNSADTGSKNKEAQHTPQKTQHRRHNNLSIHFKTETRPPYTPERRQRNSAYTRKQTGDPNE